MNNILERLEIVLLSCRREFFLFSSSAEDFFLFCWGLCDSKKKINPVLFFKWPESSHRSTIFFFPTFQTFPRCFALRIRVDFGCPPKVVSSKKTILWKVSDSSFEDKLTHFKRQQNLANEVEISLISQNFIAHYDTICFL